MSASTPNTGTAHAASEVLEEHAEGDLKGIFEDIKATFRAPLVGALFSALATQPDYLRVAWRQLHTNAQTVYFERCADDIRRLAVTSMSEVGELRTPANDQGISHVLSVLHYVNPKLLLAVSALRSSLLGQLPRVAMLPADQKRQVVPGVPASMPAIQLVNPAETDERLSRLFSDIERATPGGLISSDYRALARWPDYLEGAWTAVKPRMSTLEYRRAVRQLRWTADEAVLGFPFRMDVTPHTLRHAGLSELQVDTVRTILDHFHGALSASVANVAVFATGIEGRSRALERRYPVQLV